jgi:excisionase family DNA binding protein
VPVCKPLPTSLENAAPQSLLPLGAWHAYSVEQLEQLITSWLSVREAADKMQVSPNKVRQWIRERELIAVRDGHDQRIPADCIDGGKIVKGLGGTLTLLKDVGFGDVEAAIWLFTPDDTLPGRPIDALRENRGREVRRRAQALAF